MTEMHILLDDKYRPDPKVVAILDKLFGCLPSVDAQLPVIAGGYVRDMMAGVKPKDIDIWFPGWTSNEVTDAIFFGLPGVTSVDWRVAEGDVYGGNLRVLAIGDVIVPGLEAPLNLIIPRELNHVDMVKEFDLYTSQAYILPDGRVYASREALRDHADKVFRCTPRVDQRTCRRVRDSLLPRYPGWTFEDPFIIPLE